MGVKFFGQFLIDSGELDASHVREALELMETENLPLGQIAIAEGFMEEPQVARVNAEQRNRDLSFGDLAVDMGLLENAQLVQSLKIQRSRRLPIGQALVRLGHVAGDRLGILFDAYKADQAQYDVGAFELPDGLVSHRVSRYVVEFFPRFMLRVARMQVKIGEIHTYDGAPDFAEIRVSVPITGVRSVDVALVCDLAFGESLAEAASGLDPADLDAEMVADGIGEFLNVLCGNAASAVAKEGHPVELGPPDYEAELCDGWMVELATGVGRAALILSTF
jgi:CheY-specific phosphatase CheX